jgi:hypothetical protein
MTRWIDRTCPISSLSLPVRSSFRANPPRAPRFRLLIEGLKLPAATDEIHYVNSSPVRRTLVAPSTKQGGRAAVRRLRGALLLSRRPLRGGAADRRSTQPSRHESRRRHRTNRHDLLTGRARLRRSRRTWPIPIWGSDCTPTTRTGSRCRDSRRCTRSRPRRTEETACLPMASRWRSMSAIPAPTTSLCSRGPRCRSSRSTIIVTMPSIDDFLSESVT